MFFYVVKLRHMRALTIIKRPGSLSKPVDATITLDSNEFGELKAEQEKVELSISKGEHTVQVEIEGKDGRVYRSNAFFCPYGNKPITLYLTISGTKLTLIYNEEYNGGR